jgi:predicted Zn-dependent protease
MRDNLKNAALQAEKLLAGGDPHGAIRLAEPVARAAPRQVGIHVLLARAHRDTGNTEAALAHFRMAAEASGADADRWGEFVLELLKAGQKGRARNAAQKAPVRPAQKKKLLELAKTGIARGGAALGGVDPADAQAIQALLRAGRIAEARGKARDLLAHHPRSAFVHNLLGLAALAEDDLEGAVESFRETLRISPSFSGAAANLGFALMRADRPGEAISVLSSAASHDPKAVDVRTNLATVYLEAGFNDEAAEQAGTLLKLAPGDRDGLRIRAIALNRSGRFQESLPIIEKLSGDADRDLIGSLRFEALAGTGREDEAIEYARSLDRMRPELWQRFASLLAQTGRLQDARAELLDCIEANPEDHFSYLYYGSYARWTADDPLLDRLRALTPATVKRKTGERLEAAYYARAKAELDLGNDGEVFPALDIANRLHGENYPFDARRFADDLQSIADIWTGEALAALSGAGVSGVRPIFIVGMPRSGSTLIDVILSAHPDVTSMGEDTVLTRAFPLELAADRKVVAQAANDGVERMTAAVGRSVRYLDKFLGNFQRVGSLAAAFPNAVFIQTARDPRSVALSIYSNAMKVRSHQYSTGLEAIGRFYVAYDRLMAHWRSVLGPRVIEVAYEDLVSDPEPRIRRLLQEVGLPWNEACLSPEKVRDRIKTLSLAQVRTGIHTGSVETWRRFEAELDPFTRILREAGVLGTGGWEISGGR